MIKSETFLLVGVILIGLSLQHYALGDMYGDDQGYLKKMGNSTKSDDSHPVPNTMPHQSVPNTMIHQPVPGAAPNTMPHQPVPVLVNACNQAQYSQAQAQLTSAEQSYLNLKSKYYQDWKQLNASGNYNVTWSNYAKDNLLNSTEVGKIKQIHEQYGGIAQYCYPAPQAGGRASPMPAITYSGTVGSQSGGSKNSISPEVLPPITNGGTVVPQSGVPNSSTSDITNTKDILMEVEQPTPVPKWIKNNALYWATDQIGDSDFTSSLQYLAKNNIIHLTKPLTVNNTESTGVPIWIKGLAGSWADGKISNDYFASTIQFMVNQNIIKLSN